MRVRILPAVPQGNVCIPPSKSEGHRAVLAASLAKGTSQIRRPGSSRDIEATLSAAAYLGASVRCEGDCLWITGTGGLLQAKGAVIHCGESGSTLRFLLPVLAAAGQECHLTGEGRLLSRPLTVYEELFAKQGIPFTHTGEQIGLFCGNAGNRLSSGKFAVDGSISSQFITGLLFALPLLEGDSLIQIKPPFESRPYVDMTMQMLEQFGVRAEWREENCIFIPGGQAYSAAKLTVEGDFSQLAFFAVLGSLRGTVDCLGLPEKSCQGDRVILDILRAFGGNPEKIEDGYRFAPAALTGQEVDLADCPDLGPILTVLAAGAAGETTIINAGRLRIKESDRAAAMEEELTRLGVKIVCDGTTIRVNGGFGWSAGTEVFCHNDHRIAMSLAVLAACGSSPLILNGAECVQKSYPDFFEALAGLGVGVETL